MIEILNKDVDTIFGVVGKKCHYFSYSGKLDTLFGYNKDEKPIRENGLCDTVQLECDIERTHTKIWYLDFPYKQSPVKTNIGFYNRKAIVSDIAYDYPIVYLISHLVSNSVCNYLIETRPITDQQIKTASDLLKEICLKIDIVCKLKIKKEIYPKIESILSKMDLPENYTLNKEVVYE